jgi:(S)-3,5-dihydroxyphenylglycine transaminase
VELVKSMMHASASTILDATDVVAEVASRFPDAISLAAGHPYEGFHRIEDIGRYLQTYVSYVEHRGYDARKMLLQYGRATGQISDLIAQMLANDEGIVVPAEAVAVTSGGQEAIVVALRGLCAAPGDVLLVTSPCYAGVIGAARLLGIRVVPVPEGPNGLDPQTVARIAGQVRASGLNPKMLYVVPDFSNPSGECLDLAARHRLLAVASAEELLILEDDPYGLFGLDERPRPRLKALDTGHHVIYVGSFAKSCFPAARVGFLVADQTVVDSQGQKTLLANELATIKSLLTINTSPIGQAVVGGLLLESGCSLRRANKDKIAFYRTNLNIMLEALDEFMPAGVTWNRPAGGFFAVLRVPMDADETLLEISASRYGVLWAPMAPFYPDGGGERAMRLSSSGLDPQELTEGVRRLGELMRAYA